MADKKKTSDFVKTSDGKITVRRSDLKLVVPSDPGFMQTYHEIAVYSEATPGGRIVRYYDIESRDKALKEIQEQL